MNSLIKLLIFFSISFNKIFSYELLQKYGKTSVGCSDSYQKIAFNSSGFKLNEGIYFTFDYDNECYETKLYYQFHDIPNIDDIFDISTYQIEKSTTPVSSVNSDSKGKNKYNSYKKFYTINKDEDKNVLLLKFKCEKGSVTIENTKEDKGKQNKILIIVLVVVLCVGVIVMIVCVCIRRKKRQMQRAAMKASAAQMYSQSMGMGMGMGMVAPGMVQPMAAGYGSNVMMNNLPPQGNFGSQPVAYSRVGNDVTQLASPTPNSIMNQPSSGKRMGKKY